MTPYDRELKRAVCSAFSGDDGKRTLDEIRRFCRHGEDLFLASGNDRELSYLEGRRSVAMEIERIMEASDVIEEEAN